MACHLAVPASLAAFGSLAIARTVTVMQPTDEDILEFKRIYENETQENLTMDEAREATGRLYQCLQIIEAALPALDEATLAKFCVPRNVEGKAEDIHLHPSTT